MIDAEGVAARSRNSSRKTHGEARYAGVVRHALVAIVLSACESSSPARPDAITYDDARIDAVVVPAPDAAPATCLAESTLPLLVREAYDVASDGTTLYLSVKT